MKEKKGKFDFELQVLDLVAENELKEISNRDNEEKESAKKAFKKGMLFAANEINKLKL